jgi:acetolactate synthase II small subunit
MKQNIECEIDQVEGSLIRVLGVVERRGYKLENLNVQPLNSELYILQFCVHSERDIKILIKQLERLIDVRSARCVDEQQSFSSAPQGGHFQSQAYQASWLAS